MPKHSLVIHEWMHADVDGENGGEDEVCFPGKGNST